MLFYHLTFRLFTICTFKVELLPLWQRKGLRVFLQRNMLEGVVVRVVPRSLVLARVRTCLFTGNIASQTTRLYERKDNTRTAFNFIDKFIIKRY